MQKMGSLPIELRPSFQLSSFGFRHSQADTFMQPGHFHLARMPSRQRYSESLAAFRFTMHQKDILLWSCDSAEPVEQLAVIRMAGEGVQDLDASSNTERISQNAHLLVAVAQLPAQRLLRAVTYEEDRR